MRTIRVLVGCEHSRTVRDAFAARGADAWSCDLLPCTVGGNHYQCDLREVLGLGWDIGIFHPDCTFITGSAEWAYPDPDFERFPGKGYHQKVKPGTLTGAARREARKEALNFVRLLMDCDIPLTAIENPVGKIGTDIRQADQFIQPYNFGADASKKTGLWLKGLPVLRSTLRVQGRFVFNPKTLQFVERWSNQTDNGQNREAPGEDRWAVRSLTYPGVAAAMADQWLRFANGERPRGRLF